MEDFKQYMSEDPEEGERTAAEQIRSGLEGLRLEHKVKEVAAGRRALLRQRFRMRIVMAALLVVTGGGAILFFWKKDLPAPLEQQQLPDTPDLRNTPPTGPEGVSPTLPIEKKSPPVVENRPARNLPEPRFPAPALRGADSEDPARKALLNQVWYTDYPPTGFAASGHFAKADELLKARDFTGAYVQLQRLERNLPANDTLRYLKGYCLLELGEGAEALAYFEGMDTRQPTWKMQVEWYRGLGVLLTGDAKKALTTFRKIGDTPGHAYRKQGKKAAQLLE
jgi:hypothetical protein